MTAPTSAWRVGEVLARRAPDRVPWFLPVTFVGARLLGCRVRDYLADPARIVRGQLAWRERLGHDVLTCFHSAAAEVEAFGGGIRYVDDGPPTAAEPPLVAGDLASLTAPRPEDAPALRIVLEATRALARALRGEAPILAIVIGPFSLPAMQLGLAPWLDLLHERPVLADRLLAVNAAFTAAWANAQLAAGATAVAMAEPLASPAMVERARWRAHGRPVAAAVLRAVRGPLFFGFGSAPGAGVADDVLELAPTALVGGCGDDLAALKARCSGRAALLGGLDALALASGGPSAAADTARRALAAAGPGGGFLLTEHHGEIPWTSPDETLLAVAEAARTWGRYGQDGALVA